MVDEKNQTQRKVNGMEAKVPRKQSNEKKGDFERIFGKTKKIRATTLYMSYD